MGKNLPAQPDQKLNDSTIAGIDENKNGIRDDVELAIFKKYPDNAKTLETEGLQTRIQSAHPVSADTFGFDVEKDLYSV